MAPSPLHGRTESTQHQFHTFLSSPLPLPLPTSLPSPFNPSPPFLQDEMPELPSARRARYVGLGLPLQDVLVLAEEPSIAAFFDELLVRAEGCTHGREGVPAWALLLRCLVPPQVQCHPKSNAFAVCFSGGIGWYGWSWHTQVALDKQLDPSLSVGSPSPHSPLQATGMNAKAASNWINGDIQFYCKVGASSGGAAQWGECSGSTLCPPIQRLSPQMLAVCARTLHPPQENKKAMAELNITPQVLADMVALIDEGARCSRVPWLVPRGEQASMAARRPTTPCLWRVACVCSSSTCQQWRPPPRGT